MTDKEAREAATRLGLSAWIVEVIAVGSSSTIVELKCVGFVSADFPIAEAETWEECLGRAMQIIFGA